MKKILIVSTVSRQFYLFEQGNIEVLHSLDYEVHTAANFSDANDRLDALNIIWHPFDIQRSPFSLKNIIAYRQLKQIMRSEGFDAIHCHSPMGGVLARLAAKSAGISSVIYTAHGFHFYKGAPFINWLFYYPIEKFLSRYTDVLITINKEDYNRAQRFCAKKTVYVPGIGINTRKFSELIINKRKKREELCIPEDSMVLLTVGEMIKRKNQETILKALTEIDRENIILLICGRGELEEYLKELAKRLGVEAKVRFLGFRSDIAEICLISDMFVFPSLQEGLPVSVLEAMSAGLPVVCSSIRGNSDLIADGEGGYLLESNDTKGFAERMTNLIDDAALRQSMGRRNLDTVKQYDKKYVTEIMRNVYDKLEEQ